MEDTARRVRELQAEAEATAADVERSKKERVRVSLQLRKQKRALEVCFRSRVGNTSSSCESRCSVHTDLGPQCSRPN